MCAKGRPSFFVKANTWVMSLENSSGLVHHKVLPEQWQTLRLSMPIDIVIAR